MVALIAIVSNGRRYG